MKEIEQIELLKKNGLTYEIIAKKCNVSPTTLRKFRNGEDISPSKKQDICSALRNMQELETPYYLSTSVSDSNSTALETDSDSSRSVKILSKSAVNRRLLLPISHSESEDSDIESIDSEKDDSSDVGFPNRNNFESDESDVDVINGSDDEISNKNTFKCGAWNVGNSICSTNVQNDINLKKISPCDLQIITEGSGVAPVEVILKNLQYNIHFEHEYVNFTTQDFCAISWNTKLFTLDDEEIPWSKYGRYLHVTLRPKISSRYKTIEVIAIHTMKKAGNTKCKEILKEKIQEVERKKNALIIVAGDFNITPTEIETLVSINFKPMFVEKQFAKGTTEKGNLYDNIVLNGSAKNPQVIYDIESSNHFPIQLDVSL